MKEKRKKMIGRIILLILAGVVVSGLVIAVVWGQRISDLRTYRREIAAIELTGIDLTSVDDGVYEGSQDSIWVGAKVRVTVGDHHIEDIQLDHRHNRGIDAEVLVDEVLLQQDTGLDVVSGATSSSLVILKAIENALNAPKDEAATVKNGIYVMALESSEEAIPPRVTIEDDRISFSYDLLRSYLPVGTYTIEDHRLTMLTDDKSHQYVFLIKGETLVFLENQSSTVKLMNDKIGVAVTDQAVFKVQEQ